MLVKVDEDFNKNLLNLAQCLGFSEFTCSAMKESDSQKAIGWQVYNGLMQPTHPWVKTWQHLTLIIFRQQWMIWEKL